MLSLSVFVCLSQCVCGFTAGWQPCGSSALTMRQSVGPSGFSTISHQTVCLPACSKLLWHTLDIRFMCFSVGVVRGVSHGTMCGTRTHAFAPVQHLSQHSWRSSQINLCERLNPSNQHQRCFVWKSPVAFRRKINSFHSIYQTEHLYVCLRSYICELVLVSGQSILLILSIRVQTCFSLGTNTLYIWVFTLCMLVSEMDGRSTTVDERVGG